MPEITLNGPVVREGEDNIVLRQALFHSPIKRVANDSNYYIVHVGIREGDYTTWIGSYDQREVEAVGGTPVSMLDEGREDQRLFGGQAVVVKAVSYGKPDTLRGARVNFRLSLVGGRDGPAGPLVASPLPEDPTTKTAVTTLQRQVNESLSQWDDGVQLQDPADAESVGIFQCRLQYDSATQISLQNYAGEVVDVNGTAVSVSSDGIVCTTSDYVLSATGNVSTSTPSASTLYYVYLSSGGALALSETSPTRYLGIYYLGTDGSAVSWRFCGWAYTNASVQFTDSARARTVANYYNRVKADLFHCPGYTDDDVDTVYSATNVAWAGANGSSDPNVVWIANGEDAVMLNASAVCYNTSSGEPVGVGVAVDGITAVERGGYTISTVQQNIHVHYSDVLSAGYHTAFLVNWVNTGTGYFIADIGSNGANADVAATFISGEVYV